MQQQRCQRFAWANNTNVKDPLCTETLVGSLEVVTQGTATATLTL